MSNGAAFMAARTLIDAWTATFEPPRTLLDYDGRRLDAYLDLLAWIDARFKERGQDPERAKPSYSDFQRAFYATVQKLKRNEDADEERIHNVESARTPKGDG